VGIFFLAGCGGSKQTSSQEMVNNGAKQQKSAHKEVQRDRALKHFIDGTALDAKGSYAEAILEYQEALEADQNATIYFAISKDYFMLGKLARAAEAAAEAVRLEPKNIAYHENLGNIYFNITRIDLAIKEYEEITRIDSTYTPGWLALARLYQVSEPQKAIEIFERVLERDASQFDILFQCAQTYSTLGRFDEAAKKYKQMLELDPSNRPLQKQLAETYAKGGRLDQAIALLENMIETDSSDIEVIAALADVYMDVKKYKDAITLYQNLLQRGNKNFEIQMRIGVGFFALTAHDSTLISKTHDIFEKLQSEAPNDWRPKWYLGALALNQHQDSVASQYFEQVIKIEERNGDGWWFYGTSLFSQGKYLKLLEVSANAQKILPNDFRFYLLQGLALNRLEKQEEAVSPLEKAYKLNPKDLNTLSTLALTLDGLQRYTASDRIYEDGLKQEPNSALLLNNFSYSLAERGLQLERALEMSKQAINIEPTNAAYLDTYGWIFYKLGKFEEAAEYIEKSVATGEASSVVHEHLGDVYLKLEKKEKALEFWKKASEMDPKNQSAKEKSNRGVN
jgi:tetratricopeptide (TPR) repeat protein